ncbi:MAG: tRNA (cytidine(56)-2'-O)-methyltransferase [Candidatus Bathyarchaeota archaeon]
MNQKAGSNEVRSQKVVVLRWGHRHRDQRLTSHVALTSRALGVSEFIMADITDSKVQETIKKVVKSWGGNFKFKMGQPWRSVVKKWKEKNGVIVHLTAYGENIQTSDVMKRIQTTGKDIMIIVGSQKVPSIFFNEKISDFNVAVGNQPHSECSSLAVFLDRFFNGKELTDQFICSQKKKIIPQVRGKRVVEV